MWTRNCQIHCQICVFQICVKCEISSSCMLGASGPLGTPPPSSNPCQTIAQRSTLALLKAIRCHLRASTFRPRQRSPSVPPRPFATLTQRLSIRLAKNATLLPALLRNACVSTFVVKLTRSFDVLLPITPL
jgi:hypothetical protein